VDELIDEDSNLRTVELTPREVGLLLEHGYPFPEQAQKLRESKAVRVITECPSIRSGSR
jgi:hypothetical protein